MEKVFLIVELVEENGELIYAIQYTGVMNEGNIYAKLTQDTGCSYPEYIKVCRKDTVDETEKWNSSFSRRIFQIALSDIEKDSRIQKEPLLSDEILKAIYSHIQENEK